MEYVYVNGELYHHGVKGMKWGIRRKRKKTYENAHEDYTRAHSKKGVHEMSDVELRTRNNRLQMEKQYSELTQKKKSGKNIVKTLIATAGTIAAAEKAYKTYKEYGIRALDKIGDWVIKGLTLTNLDS